MYTSHQALGIIQKEGSDKHVGFAAQVLEGANNVNLTPEQASFLNALVAAHVASDRIGWIEAASVATWINSCA